MSKLFLNGGTAIFSLRLFPDLRRAKITHQIVVTEFRPLRYLYQTVYLDFSLIWSSKKWSLNLSSKVFKHWQPNDYLGLMLWSCIDSACWIWNRKLYIYIHFWSSSESPASEPERVQSSLAKNKHPEDDPAEVEGREVKRLKFDKEEEAEEPSSQSGSSEACSAMVEETDTTSSSPDKEKETICERQHCKEEDEEEEGMMITYTGQLLNMCFGCAFKILVLIKCEGIWQQFYWTNAR